MLSSASLVRLTIRLTHRLSIPSRVTISFNDFASPDFSMSNQRWSLASPGWLDVGCAVCTSEPYQFLTAMHGGIFGGILGIYQRNLLIYKEM